MKRPPRREILHRVGVRASELTGIESIIAWRELSERLQDLGDRDIPKFRDLTRAIYSAMAVARKNRVTYAIEPETIESALTPTT